MLSFWFVGITNISDLKEGLLTEQLYNGDKFTDVMLSKKVISCLWLLMFIIIYIYGSILSPNLADDGKYETM